MNKLWHRPISLYAFQVHEYPPVLFDVVCRWYQFTSIFSFGRTMGASLTSTATIQVQSGGILMFMISVKGQELII